MPDVTPAEEIRSASVLLRKRAEAVPQSRWMVRTFPAGRAGIHVTPERHIVVSGETNVANADASAAKYIASMDPATGLALADLLDRVAKEAAGCLSLDEPHDGADPEWFCSACDGMVAFDCHLDGALKLARLYLREEEVRDAHP